jgi:hypothetical protein
MWEKPEMNCAVDPIFLPTVGREDELLTPFMVVLWFLAGIVDWLGISCAVLSLFFLVTAVKTMCSKIG